MTWLITNTAREHYLADINAAHPDNVPTIAEIAHSSRKSTASPATARAPTA